MGAARRARPAPRGMIIRCAACRPVPARRAACDRRPRLSAGGGRLSRPPLPRSAAPGRQRLGRHRLGACCRVRRQPPPGRARGGRSSCSGRSARLCGIDARPCPSGTRALLGIRPSSRADRRQLGRAEVDVGVLAESVREVAGGGREHRRALRGPGPGCPCTASSPASPCARRPCRRCRSGLPRVSSAASILVGGATQSLVGMSRLPSSSFAGGAEVADVGHAGADEDLVDRRAGHFGQQSSRRPDRSGRRRSAR